MSFNSKSRKIKHNLKIFNYIGTQSKVIPSEHIIFADEDIYNAMFYATVSFGIPNTEAVDSEWFVGYSSSMELRQACQHLLQKYFSMPSDHEHYIFWQTTPDASVGQITVDLLDENGASVVTESIANSYFHTMVKEQPDEEKFSYFIYRTIMNVDSAVMVKPPWLTHVNFEVQLSSEKGKKKFSHLSVVHHNHSSLLT